MEYKVLASFTLTEFECLPSEITSALGIEPTRTWKLGDKINPRIQKFYEFSGWRLQSTLQESSDLEEHIASVLNQLEPSWKTLKRLCSQYDSEFSSVIHTVADSSNFPAVHFNKKTSKNFLNLEHQLMWMSSSLARNDDVGVGSFC